MSVGEKAIGLTLTVVVTVDTGMIRRDWDVSRYTVEVKIVEEMMVVDTVVVLLSVSVKVDTMEKRTADTCVKVIVLVSNTGISVVVVMVADRVIVTIAPTWRDKDAVVVVVKRCV